MAAVILGAVPSRAAPKPSGEVIIILDRALGAHGGWGREEWVLKCPAVPSKFCPVQRTHRGRAEGKGRLLRSEVDQFVRDALALEKALEVERGAPEKIDPDQMDRALLRWGIQSRGRAQAGLLLEGSDPRTRLWSRWEWKLVGSLFSR